ncbi:MAG: helix-turn-helix transcriptional regulator [Bacillota bacterium]
MLKTARKAKGLQVADLARKLHISASFYYKIEQGVRNPTLELARDIATILGRSVEELFFCLRLGQFAQ